MSLKARWFWSLLVLGVILDQVTKIWVYTNLELHRDEVVLIPSFLSIVHAQNPGAAFSMFVNFEYRFPLFMAFTVVALYVVGDMYRKLTDAEALQGAALGLILSGVVGNAIDRIHKRTVTDFIRVMFGSYEYPSFNVADSTLFVGVALLIWHGWRTRPAPADSE